MSCKNRNGHISTNIPSEIWLNEGSISWNDRTLVQSFSGRQPPILVLIPTLKKFSQLASGFLNDWTIVQSPLDCLSPLFGWLNQCSIILLINSHSTWKGKTMNLCMTKPIRVWIEPLFFGAGLISSTYQHNTTIINQIKQQWGPSSINRWPHPLSLSSWTQPTTLLPPRRPTARLAIAARSRFSPPCYYSDNVLLLDCGTARVVHFWILP